MVGEIPAKDIKIKIRNREYLQELVPQIAADKGFTVHLFERFPEIRNQLWKESSGIIPIILNIRASRINSRCNVNLHPKECLRGKKNAAVAQNICKNPAGIFQYHRAYVLCSF